MSWLSSKLVGQGGKDKALCPYLAGRRHCLAIPESGRRHRRTRGRFRIAPIASLSIADAAQQPNTMLANKSAGLRLGVVRSLSYTRPTASSASRADRVGRSQALPKACAASVRTLSTTPSLRNSSAELSKERELGAKEETNDVTAMDRLLKESRMAVESPVLSR